ncbi:MAG: TrkH family potassium uptake protein [Betaproteobacteria bacterium]|jgi:trk system potassium uptake protein TrkH|nr:TrkH family potassium uptake protein [Betaproteobacteria bacterium]MDH4292613.1 TrkH family potassium uptake protein [Betaproteobacteria bacterium]MDH5342182.1 TrkH family potassium uptake protein [Betaproteobacteria bacterium]
MNWLLTIAPVAALIAMAMSLTHLLPIGVSLALNDGTLPIWILSMALNFAAGAVLWLSTRRQKRELNLREGILLVVSVWTGGALFASVPILLTIPQITFTDAYFEAVSGLTATGATVLIELDNLPPSVNVWRALLQWLGGMGVIVLVVAVLPMLGVGGRQISKSEIPGPMKDEQLTPRVTQTAKGLWLIYAALTLACALAYHAAGMSPLDALIHSFTTLSLGGFSSHDASLGYFNSAAVDMVAICFMMIAGLNFATHFMVWRTKSLRPYVRDTEVRYFVLVIGGSIAGIAMLLYGSGVYPDFFTAVRYAAFNIISVGTTTGYSTADYNMWPVFAPLWILFLGTFLSCSGSTGGGIKMMRAVILYRQVYREIKSLAHPYAINPVKVAGQVVADPIVFAVLGFFFVWIVLLVSMTLILGWTGLDAMTAFSAVVASLNNIGPGLHQVGPATNFAVLTAFQTWVCTFAMLLGRLELFALLVVFTPAFWRK